jgi:hypothetical protein
MRNREIRDKQERLEYKNLISSAESITPLMNRRQYHVFDKKKTPRLFLGSGAFDNSRRRLLSHAVTQKVCIGSI